MDQLILSFLLVLLFCVSSRFLLKALVEPLDLMRVNEYSRRALVLEKKYKILAWGLLALFLMYSMVVSFIQTFLAL